jgi:ribose transport system substrate-binding protein
MKNLQKFVTVLLLVLLVFVFVGFSSLAQGKEFRFVIIPKVVHPWFDKVVEGAEAQARFLEEQTGDKFTIDYRAPSKADVLLQNDILEQAAATRPDGMTIDLLDAEGNRAVLESVLEQGIPVVAFDSRAPEDLGLTSVGNDFTEQAQIASERLVELLGGKGKVAIMRGFPTAVNHHERYLAHKATFEKYPDIELVAEGIDNDDIETAQKQAASIIAAHPDLGGFVSCDAAGPIGIGIAIKEAGKTGEILSVGLDDLEQLLELIKEGVVESSSSTKPYMQGSWAVTALWMEALGRPTPKWIDTGIAIITPENLDTYKGE